MPHSVTVAIPTYNREQVLLDTIDDLLSLKIPADEILVLDQTREHLCSTQQRLQELSACHQIRWLQMDYPSVPGVMNQALALAAGETILFLDDDIRLNSEIVEEHTRGHQHPEVGVVAGQVIQSWQKPLSEFENAYYKGRSDDPDAFLFNSGKSCWISRFMGGNFSIKRNIALQLGGFDENFIKCAFRFEAEFADRLCAAGHRILFEPGASILHQKHATGGIRSFGDPLTTMHPCHSVGHYYYLLAAKSAKHRRRKLLLSPVKGFMTQFHLRNPWWIPAKFIAEIWGLLWALSLYMRRQKTSKNATEGIYAWPIRVQ